MIYGSKNEVILKMLLLYLVESIWRNAHSIRFFKIRDRPFGFLFRGRGCFFQQLKLDIFRDLSESIYFLTIKSFLQLLIVPIRLNIN